MTHRISSGLKFDELESHVIKRAPLKPILSRKSLVRFAEYAKAPSCINMALRLNARGCFLYHGLKIFCRKSM